MNTPDLVFHLAIPCRNLEEAKTFYVDRLGAQLARSYDDRITLNFYGAQVVCHKSDKIDPKPEMYPRHFGLTFKKREPFDAILKRAQDGKLEFFAPPFVRFEGRKDEHRSFFLKDPSNNLIEFKYYKDPVMMY